MQPFHDDGTTGQGVNLIVQTSQFMFAVRCFGASSASGKLIVLDVMDDK